MMAQSRATRSARQASTDQATDQATDQTTASRRGRMPRCGQPFGNGSVCELPKGHDGDHDVVKLTDEELTDIELSEEDLAALLGETRTPGIRPTEQLRVDAQVADNYAAWVAAGSDPAKPVWKVKAVEPQKRGETEKLLRKAADFHTPKVGMRTKRGPIRDGKALVIWAAVKRMEASDQGSQS